MNHAIFRIHHFSLWIFLMKPFQKFFNKSLLGFCLIQFLFGMLGFKAMAGPRLVDLTHSFDETTIYWPTSKPFTLENVHEGFTPKGYWYESNNFSGSEHGGTHLDAPAHFARDKWHIEEIPLNRLMAFGIVVDVRKHALNNPDYLIRKQDFVDWEKQHGKIPENATVLVLTGWESFWPDKKRYLGTDKPGDVGNLHFPGFSAGAARFLVNERNIGSIGLDTPSLDAGQSKNFIAHQIFGEANVPGYENVCNLATLPAKGMRVIALPMKIGKGSGAPLRIVAEIN
jgi:kynurenine formamidase